MKFMLSLLAIGYVAIATPAPSLPVHPGGIGGLFKGPNSETIIKGPDGSVITSAAEGGEVHTGLEPIIVAEPAIIEEVPPVVEAVAIPAPLVENEQSSDLIGPSGRIATKGSQSVIAGPASTTITGPAIVAGTPVVTTSVLGPVRPIAELPLSVTPTSLIPIAAEVSPFSVTASPVATVTAAVPLPTVTTAELGRTALVSIGTPLAVAAPSLATVTATPPVATVTAIPQAFVTGTSRPIATASVSPHLSVATAAGGPGASVTATASPNLAAAEVETVTATPAILPAVTNVGSGFFGINDRIDLGSQFLRNQIAADNRQLNLNHALIPPANIIPPEISVTPRIPIGRLRPTPGTLFTTPGLGAVASSNNIQRREGDVSLSVTPSTLQVTPQVAITPEVLRLPNRQGLLHNQISYAQTLTPNIQTNGAGLTVTPNSFNINPQINFTPEQALALQNGAQNVVSNIQGDLGTLSVTPNSLEVDPQVTFNADQVAAIQSQQILVDSQGRRVQQVNGPGILQPTPLPIDNTRNPVLFTPNIPGNVANIPQQSLLSEELAKSGVDASQLQLTNIPLSAVSGLPFGGLRGGINDGLGGEAWGRYGRDAKKEETKKTK